MACSSKKSFLYFRNEKFTSGLHKILNKFRSCICLVIFVLSIISSGFTLHSLFYIKELFNSLVFLPLLTEFETPLYDRHNIIRKEFIVIMAIVPLFFFIICIVEFSHWCNLSFIQGIRANERRIDMRSFSFSFSYFLQHMYQVHVCISKCLFI